MNNILSSTRVTALLIAVLLIQFSYSRVTCAQNEGVTLQTAGDLDPTFGNGGKALADFAGKETLGSALAIQPDGKLIEVGSVVNATADIAIARFNADGTLDPSFGSGGIVITDINGTNNSAAAVALQPDGRIVVAGSARDSVNNQSFDFALARYNTDGSLDTGFGSGGKVRTDVTGRADIATSLVILSTGRLVVGGETSDANATDGLSNRGALVGYNADGSLDKTFGNDGKVLTDVAGFGAGITCLAVLTDGKIAAGGFANFSADESAEGFALLCYKPNGALNQSFGAGGKVTTTFSGSESAQAIAVQSDGKIVLTGWTVSNQVDFAIARYNSDGSLDTTFGVGGKVITDFAGNVDSGRALSVQTDNKIIAGGWLARSNDSDSRDFALARYNVDGSLDTTFGSAGKIATDFEGLGDLGAAMLLQSDGKLVFAGSATHSTGPTTSILRMVAARYALGLPAAPGFSLSFQEPLVNGLRGTKTPVFLQINRTGGFTGNVTITPPDFPGITPKPHEPISTSSDQVKFKLKIKASAAVGHLSLTFTGADDAGHTATATVTVIVQ